jgi:prophage regulatory protein
MAPERRRQPIADLSAASAPLILRQRQVAARTGLPVSTIYAMITAGTFPAPIPLSKRSVGWLLAEVDGWIAARIEARERGERSDLAGRHTHARRAERALRTERVRIRRRRPQIEALVRGDADVS